MEAGGIGPRDPTVGGTGAGVGGPAGAGAGSVGAGAVGAGIGGPGAQDPTMGGSGRAIEALRRPITADPGPLGLAAFAMTTFVLSVYNSGVLSGGGLPVVFSLALFYGGVAQLLAGMWEFRTGNTFGALAFSSYGAFWLSFWALETLYAKDLTGGATVAGHAVAVYLTGWAFFTTYMLVASLRTTGAIALVFALLALTYALLAIGAWGDHVKVTHAGGVVGIVTAAAAWYASFAAVTNATFKRTVLPVFPLAPAEPVATTA